MWFYFGANHLAAVLRSELRLFSEDAPQPSRLLLVDLEAMYLETP